MTAKNELIMCVSEKVQQPLFGHVKSLKAKQYSLGKVNRRGSWMVCSYASVWVCVCEHGRQSNCKIIHIARGPVLGLSSMPHTNTDIYTHNNNIERHNKESGKGRRNYKERMFRLISKHGEKRVKETARNERATNSKSSSKQEIAGCKGITRISDTL